MAAHRGTAGRPMLDRTRFTNERHHLCGCRTAFDTEDWRSVTFGQCAEHLAVTGGPRHRSAATRERQEQAMKDQTVQIEGHLLEQGLWCERCPTWQVTSCHAPPYEGAEEYLVALLAAGWEPFAATATAAGFVTYHLRRHRSITESGQSGSQPRDTGSTGNPQ